MVQAVKGLGFSLIAPRACGGSIGPATGTSQTLNCTLDLYTLHPKEGCHLQHGTPTNLQNVAPWGATETYGDDTGSKESRLQTLEGLPVQKQALC